MRPRLSPPWAAALPVSAVADLVGRSPSARALAMERTAAPASDPRPVARTGALASTLVGALVLGVYALRVQSFPFLVDDAYISFRYAKNLVDGVGLVFNAAERVEGYTNFLWVLLVALGMKLGLPPETVALALGAAAGLGGLFAVAAFAARRSSWRDLCVWVGPALLVALPPYAEWASGGLETQLFTFLVTAGLLRCVVEGERGLAPWGSALLLSVATLTRPDGALFLAIAGAAVLVDAVRERGRHPGDDAILRKVALFALPVCLVALHVVFRMAYYGWPVPNTFYAKVDGADWGRGLRYLELFHADSGLGWVVLPLLALVVARRSRTDAIVGASLVAWVAYVCAIGGDIFEFRMLVPALPLFVVLWTEPPPVPDRLRRASSIGGAVAVAALVMACSGGTGKTGVRGGVASARSLREYTRDRQIQGDRLLALVATGDLPADLRIATAGAGALPYVAGLYTVDVLGLNDETVAHEAEAREGARLGHEKRASKGYLAERRVDMLDVAGGFWFRGDGPSAAERATATRRTRKFNETDGVDRLVVRCRRVDGGHLLFASPLTDAEFEQRLGHLPPCGRSRYSFDYP